ncbi:hypothetical protein Tco_1254112 [Tanacetum coccineum]
METKDTLSSCSYSDEQDMQQMLKQAKILKGSCLNGLSALKSNFTRKLEQGITKSEFERAFSHIFGEDVDTFTRTFSQNMDTLEQQLTKETILESNCQNAFRVLKTQFEKIFSSVLIKPSSLDGIKHWDRIKREDTSSRLGMIAHADDAISAIYDEEPMVEGGVPTGKIFTSSTTKVDSEPQMVQMTISRYQYDANKSCVSAEHPSDTYVLTMKMEILLEPASNKLLLKSDSLPHAHAQSTKTFYKHQDSKNQESLRIKDKDSTQTTDIQDTSSQRYSSLSREIVRCFQDDCKGLGSNTPTGVPYTKDEIMAIVRGGTFSVLLLTQPESQPEYGGGSGNGGCGDDELGDDKDGS